MIWATMLALHLWPLGKVLAGLVAGEGGFGALATLLATQALFAAKLADVRWLRLPSRKGALVAFLLATCFAHPETTLTELGHATKSAAVATLAVAPVVAKARPKRWLTDWLRAASRATATWRDVVGTLVRRRRALTLVPVLLLGAPPGRAPPRSTPR